MRNSGKVERTILTGLLTALVTVLTVVIAVPVPLANGYVHLGDGMIFLAVLILGRNRGALAAGLGSAFADLVLGYAVWAPWTFVIKGFMAFAVGFVTERCVTRRGVVLSCLATVALWFVFNAAVQGLIAYESAHNAAALADALRTESPGAANATLAAVLGVMRSRIMFAALPIPVILLALAFALRKKENLFIPVGRIVGMTVGGLVMVFGYFAAGGFLYGNFAVAAFAIPANMIQFSVGFVVASVTAAALARTPVARRFAYGRDGGARRARRP